MNGSQAAQYTSERYILAFDIYCALLLTGLGVVIACEELV